jgi:hypothetical protein
MQLAPKPVWSATHRVPIGQLIVLFGDDANAADRDDVRVRLLRTAD